MNKSLITIFTPTFNRAEFLPKVYYSLKNQEYKEFEWVIVDDGSSDNTETVINSFIQDQAIVIHYIKQPMVESIRLLTQELVLLQEIFF